jgi:hypothetical protein
VNDKFDKFKVQVLENAKEQDAPSNVQTTDDESKGILQGESYIDKLRELNDMMDNAPRKFKRKYRNTENSFSSRMMKSAQSKI